MQKQMTDGERELWDEMQADAMYDDDDGLVPCSWCGGDGEVENDDPLVYAGDYIPCRCCNGRGHSQTIW
jgi:hypothetical protein